MLITLNIWASVYFYFIAKQAIKFCQKHDAVYHTQAEFKWGVKDGREVPQLEPHIQQIGFYNYTKDWPPYMKGWRKMCLPFLYLMNNRLGMYKKEADSHQIE